MRDDAQALKQELIAITDRLYAVTHGSFMQINPSPHSDSYVDPIVWAKTVAPFAVPIHEGVQGPSGTSSPIFHLLDIFFERRTYESILGQESLHLRTWYPPHWRDFLAAVARVSVRDYVSAKGDQELTGLYQETLNAYAGEDGFLGRHRLKVYGYLELAFKIGRSVTIGGFSGLFQDRAWDEVDDALEVSRLEREQRALTGWHTVTTGEPGQPSAQKGHAHALVLSTAGAGIRYHPGDRCCILPENDPALVAKTLRALRAEGEEPVLLTQVWQRALLLRAGYEQMRELSLRTLLRFGRIRPVERSVAKLLYRITAHPTLAQIVEARAEDQWELWDLLDLLTADGFDPTTLWQAHPADRESICWLVPPETYRMYSIASAADADGAASELHLLAGHLRYQTPRTAVTHREERQGTGSSFLTRLTQGGQPHSVSVKIVRPPRFRLPADPTRPLVLFAGGTGIAPFLGFIHRRRRQPDAGAIWLFYADRTGATLPSEAELAQAVATGQLHLHVALSQEDVGLSLAADGVGFRRVAGQRRRIDAVMLADANAQSLWTLVQGDAVFYICGRADFARTVTDALTVLIGRFTASAAEEGEAAVQHTLYNLVAQERLHQEIYTTYTGAQVTVRRQINVSEIVMHNDDIHDHWIVLDGRVYDLTDFLHMHPGGVKILRGYTGMDGTPAYRKVLHHVRPEVHAQLALYEIGVVRRLRFGAAGGVVLAAKRPGYVTLADAYRRWVRFLYLVVEMENALHNDFSIREGALTQHETAAEHSPYKLQLVAEVHERFLHNYVNGLAGPDLAALWAVIVGLCDPRADVRWLEQTLDEIMQRSDAQIVASAAEHLTQRVPEEQVAAREELAALLARLEEEDRRFLRQVKLLLRRGLQIFERYEEATLQHGSQELLAVVRQIPTCFADYFTAPPGQRAMLCRRVYRCGSPPP